MTSKGGLALPPELWGIILPMARDEPYVLVEAELISEAEGERVLECREVTLDGRAGHVFSSMEVDAYERVLNEKAVSERVIKRRAAKEKAAEERAIKKRAAEERAANSPGKKSVYLLDENNELDEDSELDDDSEWDEDSLWDEDSMWDEDSAMPEIQAGNSTYQVVIKAGEKRPCVFTEIGVGDVIARLEGGKCGLCDGERFVCPMHNAEFKMFVGVVVRIGCPGDLACPLCLANVFYKHMDFLEAYDQEMPSKRERKQMNLSIKMALREMGYPPVLKYEGNH